MTNAPTSSPLNHETGPPTRRQRFRHAAFALAICAVTGLALKLTIPMSAVHAEGERGPSGRPSSPAASATGPASPTTSYTTLRDAMHDGLSPSFGELSVYAFHGVEMDEEAFKSVIASATTLRNTAREVPLLAKRHFTAADKAFFLDLANQLGVDAEAMHAAALRRDLPEVTRFMTRIDATCQSCHARLAPHLTQER